MEEETRKIPLGDADRAILRFRLGKGTVESFSLQYECSFDDGETWTPVRRYDSSHQYVHVHIFRPDGERTEEWLGLSFKDGLDRADQELRDHWTRFRREYDEARQGKGTE